MTRLLIKNFLRSRGLMLGLLLLFLGGLISLHIGKIFLERQARTVEKTAEFQEEDLQRHLGHTEGDLGLLMYYIRFGFVNETSPLAGLAIGHRDIHPSVHSVNIRNLEEQKYTSELVNPFYQLLGNMDFSFVIIYLFPLIVIAFCFNILSEEKEDGTWRLVLSQTEDPIQVIRNKLWIRMGSIILVFSVLLVMGKVYLGIPMGLGFAAYIATSTLYLLFWFALVWFVISTQQSSQRNAMILLATWVALTIIVPATVNALIINLYPVPEAYSTMIDGREGYHEKWDMPKDPTINKFKEKYPQFSGYEHPDGESFSWFWYFAMQQMGDSEAAASSQTMKMKLRQRDRFSKVAGYLFPSIHTQFTLNRIGRTDLINHINFLESLESFHEEKRLYFYPKIFENESTDVERWEEMGLEYWKDIRRFSWLAMLPLIIASLLLCAIATMRWSRGRH